MSTIMETVTIPIIDRHGILFVEGTRIPIDTVLYAYDSGAAAEEIVYRYPKLKLSAVYAIIAYYLNNRETLNDYLRRREAERAEIRTEMERQFPPHELRQRLLARQMAAGG